MKIKVTVVYTLDGAMKTDVLVGTNVTLQRRGDSLDVGFPYRDGRYEHPTGTGGLGLDWVNYRHCDKVTRELMETDI